MAYLTRTQLDLGGLVAGASAPDRGGIATFLGIVRDQHQGRAVRGIEYSAYEPMAEAVCGEIVREAETRWPVRIALRHRLGELGVGDAAVAVVAASPHRDAAFTACRYVIDAVKRRVPIWKRERYADGTEEWLDPTQEGSGNRELGMGSNAQ